MKRKKITGSIHQRRNSRYWSLIIYYYDENGKRKQKWETTTIPTPGNKREATELLRQRIDELERVLGDNIDLTTTITDLVNVWLIRIKPEVRASTYEKYRMNSQKIIDYYKKKPIPVIEYSRADVRIFLQYLTERGKINPKTSKREPMATNSIRDIKNVLRMVLQEAVEEDIILQNPVDSIKIKKKQKTTNKSQYMDIVTAQEFIDYIYGINDELADLITVAINYGLRRSEILGLRQSDIDLEARTITIAHTVTHIATIHAEENTKNASSARVIPIAAEEVEFWQRIFSKNEKNRQELADIYTDTDYVFHWADGTPYRPDYVTNHSKILLKAFGEPDLHFHSFRHTYASLLYSQGVDLLTAQRLLGHTEGSDVTLGVYTHTNRNKMKAHPVGLMPTIKNEKEN